MKAIGYQKAGPINAAHALEDIEIAKPELRARDLLVAVKGISINPVDSKIRTNISPETGHKVIGYDACGTVVAVGDGVANYKVGDDVFVAGEHEDIPSFASGQLVFTATAIKDVFASTTGQLIRSILALKDIIAFATNQGVIFLASIEVIITTFAVEFVTLAFAVELVRFA